VLFARTTALVHKLQVARRELEAALTRLDRFDLLISDDLAYVTKDQADQRAVRADQRPLRTALAADHRQPTLRRMEQDLPDPVMTLAAVDRRVHHATILEMNVERYRRRTALERQKAGLLSCRRRRPLPQCRVAGKGGIDVPCHSARHAGRHRAVRWLECRSWTW
jgi:DNA replication protein DnaC